MTPVLFIGFSVLLVASSLLVILHKNPVTSALFLIAAFCSLAGIYLVLQAEFIGMVQIIVYAGAIMVLFLFVIMYLNLGQDVETGVQIAFRRGFGWIIGAALVIGGVALFGQRWALGPSSPETLGPRVGNTQALGALLYSRYLFPFEVTSMVLLVAMVGAIVITKGRGPSRSATRVGTGGQGTPPFLGAAHRESAASGEEASAETPGSEAPGGIGGPR